MPPMYGQYVPSSITSTMPHGFFRSCQFCAVLIADVVRVLYITRKSPSAQVQPVRSLNVMVGSDDVATLFLLTADTRRPRSPAPAVRRAVARPPLAASYTWPIFA